MLILLCRTNCRLSDTVRRILQAVTHIRRAAVKNPSVTIHQVNFEFVLLPALKKR